MARRKVDGWKVPAPTSMSRGWRITQPWSAQYCCRARINPWKVETSGVDPEVVADVVDERVIAESTVGHEFTGRQVYNHRKIRSEEHTSEPQSRPHLVCRLLLEKKKRRDRCA